MYIRRFLYRHKWWYKLWRRLLVTLSHVMISVKPPLIQAWHIRKLMNTAQPGDIVLRKYKHLLDGLPIPGEYSHSGIVVDSTNMVHAVGTGIQYIDIIDFVKDCDGFLLLRPPYKTDFNRDIAVSFARNRLGNEYDYLFDNVSDKAFYCHELSWKCMCAALVATEQCESHVIVADDIIAVCQQVLTCPSGV